MKRLVQLGLAVLWFSVAAQAQYVPPELPSIPLEGFAAGVNGRIITIGDVMALAGPDLERLQMSSDDPETIRTKYLDLFKRALRVRIQEALVLEEFSTMENAVFPEHLVDQEIDRIIRERFKNNRADFLAALTSEEIPLDQYRTRIREQLIVQQMQQLEVYSRVTVSPKAVRELYEQEKDRYLQPAAVLLRVITIRRVDPLTGDPLTGADDKLAALQADLADPDASFEELAKTYSEDSFAAEGGLWGWREPKEYLQVIRVAIENRQPGERTGLIETAAAYYIILVENRREETSRSFEEVRDEIEGEIREREARKLREQWIERLRRKHYVHVYEGVPNPFDADTP